METTSPSDIAIVPIAPTLLTKFREEDLPWINPAASNIEHLLTGKVKDQVLAITRELFPGPVSSRVDDDPEHPGYRYSVIEAQASGEPVEAVGREMEWHRRLMAQFPALAGLRLSLSFV
ncbi:MAG: hypothetical protein ACKVP0_01110 [Pirellulaceae bacterium]